MRTALLFVFVIAPFPVISDAGGNAGELPVPRYSHNFPPCRWNASPNIRLYCQEES
jgi:hypothetical protein